MNCKIFQTMKDQYTQKIIDLHKYRKKKLQDRLTDLLKQNIIQPEITRMDSTKDGKTVGNKYLLPKMEDIIDKDEAYILLPSI